MLISIEHYSKTIKGNKVLDDICMELSGGRIYGLQGINGSGKTMLMKAVCGLIRPTEGTVIINGKRLGKDISFPESIGILIENPAFISKYTGLKNLNILAALQNRIKEADIRDILKKVGLDPDDKRVYRKYSLGMKQRLGIACALMEKPDLLLLDEPFNALDERGIVLVKELILSARERGALIIIACHDKTELEFLSDEIYTINKGSIAKHYQIKEQ